VDERAEEEEVDNEVELEEDAALLPLTNDVLDLDMAGWGKREDGSPVKSDEDVVTGVAVAGCVGDDNGAPVGFWLLFAPLVCALIS